MFTPQRCGLLCSLLAMAVNATGQTAKTWGQLPNGQEAHLYTLVNAKGMKAVISDYGATVVKLYTRDASGKLGDVVLGFNSLDDYRTKSPYFGSIVGRYGNRIAGGSFSLNGKTYNLAKNNTPGGMPCSLHGGIVGYDKRVWSRIAGPNPSSTLTLKLVDPAGSEGFPGTVTTLVTYKLTSENALSVEYKVTTTAATPVNLTHHSYFNLDGEGDDSILDHTLWLNCSRYTPVDKGLIPTGQLASVKGTPFDFLTGRELGDRINNLHPQLDFGGGYDHNFVADKPYGKFAKMAEVRAKSGRTMSVYSTEPGIQLYCGNFLDNTLVGKSGRLYGYRSGFCLETQHYPDSPNQPNFPTTILKPGKPYYSVTEYRFGTVQPEAAK